jgi:hypothetical protein
VGIRLGGEEPLYYVYIFPHPELVIDPSSFRRFDFGVAAGGGFALGQGEVSFFLDAQRHWGFLDLDPLVDDPDFRTRALVLRTGVSWRGRR